MRKIKVVVLLVQQLQHGFTKNAKVSPNLTVAQMRNQISQISQLKADYYGMYDISHSVIITHFHYEQLI